MTNMITSSEIFKSNIQENNLKKNWIAEIAYSYHNQPFSK